MKQELLEHLIRHCIREVLTQVREIDNNTKGVLAPPADGTGTMALSKSKEPTSEALDENLQKVIKKVINEILDKR